MGTVTIGSAEYTIYGTHAAAIEYLAASLSASAWASASDTRQKQALVTATRKLDALEWASDYETFGARNAETEIQEASYEWAAALLEGGAGGAQAGNVKSISDKGLAIEFFAPTPAGTLPTAVMDLLVDYLAATAGGYGTPVASGTCEETAFEESGADPGTFDLSDAVG